MLSLHSKYLFGALCVHKWTKSVTKLFILDQQLPRHSYSWSGRKRLEESHPSSWLIIISQSVHCGWVASHWQRLLLDLEWRWSFLLFLKWWNILCAVTCRISV